jgi:endonuclease/exonuclease/phosphatase family metal-dependent hydrolase
MVSRTAAVNGRGRLLRVATYNVHKCQGVDRRVMPSRIAQVMREVDADVWALQEVLSIPADRPEMDQANFLARELGYHMALGHVRELRGGLYGNVVLSRYPVAAICNYDISVQGREERGCLRSDVDLGEGEILHVFNVHLGTAFLERRHQARLLVTPEVLHDEALGGHRVVLGDFNEWTRGLTTQLLASHFECPDMKRLFKWSRTYPGILPFMHLDHIYHDASLKLEHLLLHRSRTALIASDHLPLAGDFVVAQDSVGFGSLV